MWLETRFQNKRHRQSHITHNIRNPCMLSIEDNDNIRIKTQPLSYQEAHATLNCRLIFILVECQLSTRVLALLIVEKTE
jgi:hypothetical protein